MATDADWPSGRPFVRFLEHCGLWWANCIWCGGHWPGRTMQEAQDLLIDDHLTSLGLGSYDEVCARVDGALGQASDKARARDFFLCAERLTLRPDYPRCSPFHDDNLEPGKVQCTADP